jgi:hypothetical protein
MLLSMLIYYLRGLDFIDTECTAKNMPHLLSLLLRNVSGTGALRSVS